MLKVFNRNPHFMRDAVIVDSYADAWDIICSMQQRLGKLFYSRNINVSALKST